MAAAVISGTTRLFGIFGDPVAQVKAPQAFNQMALNAGSDAVMVPFHVAAEDLATAVAGVRALKSCAGFVLTIPHKVAILDHLDEVGPMARVCGALNAVRKEADGRLVGEMFDGAGLVRGVQAAGFDPAGKRALLVGAGGAGRAIAAALAASGVADLAIANRTRDKAEELAGRIQAAFPDIPARAADPDPEGFELVVNATSIGMKPDDPFPIDPDRLTPQAMVAEVIMEPDETALLKAAEARGCRTSKGRAMLVNQLPTVAEFIRLLG